MRRPAPGFGACFHKGRAVSNFLCLPTVVDTSVAVGMAGEFVLALELILSALFVVKTCHNVR